MKNIITQLLGWIGVLLILTAYFLITFGFLTTAHPIYPVLNLMGSLFVLIEALSKKDYQPVLLNIVWLLIAFLALVKLVL
jgi:lipid-A-disaccharide synthase-like uncharacterized protein